MRLTSCSTVKRLCHNMSSLQYKPDIQSIKQLRTATDAPFKDVKNALIHSHGDFNSALDWLRKIGMATANAKKDRSTAEGLIGICTSKNAAAMVQINSETDFVAMNSNFQSFVTRIASNALKAKQIESDYKNDVEKGSLLSMAIDAEEKVSDRLAQMIAKMGENIVIHRGCKFHVEKGIIARFAFPTEGECIANFLSITR